MKNVILICLFVVMGVLGYLYFDNLSLLDDQDSKIEAQLKENAKISAKYDSLTRARKDSIITIDHYIYAEGKKKEEAKEEIQNTSNVDSVIANYEKYRPGESGMKAIDSNSITISKDEAKFATGKYIDLNFLNTIKVPGIEEKIGMLKRVADDRDSVIFVKDNSISLLMDEVKNLTPSFWSKVIKWIIILGSFGAGYLLGT